MKKQEVDHVLRAAGRITGERRFVIVGSQALHGTRPDLADQIMRSFEVDLIAAVNVQRTEWLNTIGQDSPFHEQFGYYADPVDENTAVLPKGWKGRLVALAGGETEGVNAMCLEPHDLVLSKYAARRDKDLVFNRELARRGIVSRDQLLTLLQVMPVSAEIRERIRQDIENDFAKPKGSRR